MANANTQLFGYELQLSSNLMKLTHFYNTIYVKSESLKFYRYKCFTYMISKV